MVEQLRHRETKEAETDMFDLTPPRHSSTLPPTGAAASGNRPGHLHVGSIDLEVPRNADRPGQLASRQPPAERRAHPITGIRQHAAKAYTRRNDAIEFRQGHLRLRPCHSIFSRNARSLQSCAVARPTLRKEQPQRQHDRHLAARQRQRHQGLAVGGLAQRRSVLRRNPHRMRALLGYRSVVDHQNRIAAANKPIRLNQQFGLYWSRVPHPGGNEVVQLIVVTNSKPLRHRLNALAIARADQTRYVKRTHPPPRLVPQPLQKRLQPASELLTPIQYRASHGRPLQKPTTHESPKN